MHDFYPTDEGVLINPESSAEAKIGSGVHAPETPNLSHRRQIL